MGKRIEPFGTWESPLSALQASVNDTRLRNLQVAGKNVYWLEVRPAERGRGVVVAWSPESGARDVTPAGSDVGSRVHEYGGGEYRAGDTAIVFSEKSDGSIWLIEDAGAARKIVAVAGCRYVDFEFDVARRRIYAVREDHSERSPVNPANTLVALEFDPHDPTQNEGNVIAGGHDFVASPRLAPDGNRLAWIAWEHPNMPWDQTRLYVTDLAGREPATLVAGERGEAIEQIAWSPKGILFFNSDRSGWSNVYALEPNGERIVHAEEHDFSIPGWQFRPISIAPLARDRVLASFILDGMRKAALLEAGRRIDLPLGQVQGAPQPAASGMAFIALPPDEPPAVRLAKDLTGTAPSTLRRAAPPPLAQSDVSLGEPMTFTVGAGEVTHAFFYAPRNGRFAGPPGARPPLLVTSHGGPTSMVTNAFNVAIQFWTTRGFAVADINYRGSTGYGTAYRNRLRGEWGVVDVQDCIAVAEGLIDAEHVDPERIAIRGGSASGFTTLAALAASNVFGAGAAYFPVTDLAVFAGETHKFESRYMDSLIGPYPEAADAYRRRSPVTNAGKIRAPVAIFQGLDDKVVPPHQSELMVAALEANGTPVEYHAYAGEGHGFLKAASLQDALETELAFYLKALGLTNPALKAG